MAALSLKGRALKCLAAREHSRVELARKLASHAASPDELEALLDQLEAKGLLSQQRFIESVVHRKAGRMGAARVRQALAGHGLDGAAISQALAGLSATEFERAWALWQKKYGTLAPDTAGRARQTRFLMARGFGGDVIRRVLRRASEEAGGEGERLEGAGDNVPDTPILAD